MNISEKDPNVKKILDNVYFSLFEKVIEDQFIINHYQNVVAKESKLSIRSVTPYTKTQVNFLNGNQFYGDINECRMSGNGRYLWADGTLYEGEFRRPNIIEGRGIFTFRNREASLGFSEYCGSFMDGRYHGKGQLTNYFFKYNGSFENDSFNGKGIIKVNMESFEGCFQNDKKVCGKRIYSNGTFIGEFDATEQRKCGKYEFANGDIYVGAFINGTFTGFGEYFWNSMGDYDMSYIGYWRNNYRSDIGMLKLKGVYCVTIFRMGIKDGAGIVWARNGRIFISSEMFRNDEFIECIEIDISGDNMHILRKLLNPVELQMKYFDIGYFNTMIAILKDTCCRHDSSTFYPFHACWFDLNVDHDAIWNFVRHHPNSGRGQEVTSLYQAIREHVMFVEEVNLRYAVFSSMATSCCSGQMSRVGLWQMFRDLGLHQKSSTFNSQMIIEKAEKAFNILTINPNNPKEIVSISSLVQYLLFVTLYLNEHDSDVLSCSINQRSEIFGLFATMFIVVLREFFYPVIYREAPFHGMIPRLIHDDRSFFTNFLNILNLRNQKLTIRNVFKVVQLWKSAQMPGDGFQESCGNNFHFEFFTR